MFPNRLSCECLRRIFKTKRCLWRYYMESLDASSPWDRHWLPRLSFRCRFKLFWSARTLLIFLSPGCHQRWYWLSPRGDFELGARAVKIWYSLDEGCHSLPHWVSAVPIVTANIALDQVGRSAQHKRSPVSLFREDLWDLSSLYQTQSRGWQMLL